MTSKGQVRHMKKYMRCSLEVEAVKYELGKGLEDGFMPWTSVVTTGWIKPDNLIQITREDGVVVCPFVQNRRGLTFLREDGIYTHEHTYLPNGLLFFLKL